MGTGAPSPRVEVAGRVAFVLLCLTVLPSIFWGDVPGYWEAARDLSPDHLPYRDFVWSFPPLTLAPVGLARILRSDEAAFVAAFGVLMASAEYAGLVLLRQAFPDRATAINRTWYAAAIPLSTVAYFRFDYLAVLFAVLAVVAWSKGRSGAGAVVAGVMVKLWPAVLLGALVAARRWRAAASTVTLLVAAMTGWWAFSPEGFGDFVAHREGVGFNVETTAGAVGVLAGADPALKYGTWVVELGRWEVVNLLGTMGFLVLAGWVVGRRRATVSDPVLLAGGLVVALLLTSRLLSPQFVVWALPFVALARGRGDRWTSHAFVAASVLTFLFLQWYEGLIAGDPAVAILVLVRNALLVAVAARLLRAPEIPNPNTCSPPPAADRVGLWPTPSSSAALASTTSGTSTSSSRATG